ncbi:MAG: adenylate/guanylate cyclase domain-containing protein, partial [FCB group bacterium]|nr:adenylate/guanylate cyclase domain-containing protein [FCB group bacterium]
VFLEAMQYAAERGTAVILGAKRGYETNRYPYPDYLVAPSERLGWQANREDMPYSIGLVDHPDDADGVSRKYMMFTSFSDDPGTFIPSLAVQAVLEYTGSSNQTHWEFDAESLEFSIGQVKLKSYRRENAFLLNYWGPASSIYKTFNRYPLSDILDTEDYELAAEDSDIMDIYMFHPRLQPFRDKIVIVGSSLLEDHDFVITPFYSYAGSEILMPGMETHANAIQQIMSNDFITVPTGSLNYTSESGILHFIIIFIFTVITVFIGLKLNPFTSAMAATALVVLWLSISVGAFVTDWLWLPKWSLATLLSGFSWQWLESALTINVPDMNSSVMLPVVFPMASIIFAFGINLTYRLVTEHRDKSFLKQTFGTYISPELINQMYMEKRSPKLGGVQNYHSAFFADIQGFSTFSELLAPEDLVDLLNEYLTEMTNILLENNGTLDKYIGDAIVAFYGAPVAVPDHEYRVCLTAVQMQARLEELHEKWRSEADRWPEIVLHMRNRIGINSGPFVTGNMGSTMRMDYTMVGDSVNTAARLESSAKQYGVYIQVAESTYLKAGDSFVWRELDHVIVVGKNEALKVYELIGEIGNVPDVYDRLIPLFEEGLNAYKNQDWDKAIQLFTECDKMELMYPGRKTNPSRVYLKRCCDFLINPPEKNWDGVFRLTTK